MFKLLIVSATFSEAAFLSRKKIKAVAGKTVTLEKTDTFQLDLLVTGVGITATTYHLTNTLHTSSYDMAINIGICGSLDPSILPVRVVNIKEDRFAGFGAESGNDLLDVFEAGLTGPNEKPYKKGVLQASYKNQYESLKALPSVKGITVQLVHGTTASAKKAFHRYGTVMESMEGAAFFYVCLMEKIPCMQIRSVSNMVTKRDKNKWKIKEALEALAGVMSLLLLEIKSANS